MQICILYAPLSPEFCVCNSANVLCCARSQTDVEAQDKIIKRLQVCALDMTCMRTRCGADNIICVTQRETGERWRYDNDMAISESTCVVFWIKC